MTADGAVVPDVARQSRLMLACLALAGPKGFTRSELCALFWPDRPSAQARNSLRQGLAAIRKVLSGEGGNTSGMSLHSDLEMVRLLADAMALDVEAFRDGLKRDTPDGLLAAAHAYQGELLAGVEVSEEVERFLSAERRNLADQAQRLAERLSLIDGADGEVLDTAQELAERLLKDAPAAEEAHRALMRVHIHRGRATAALRQFEQCRLALRRELQAEPDVETRRLVGSIQSSESSEHHAAGRAAQRGPTASDGESMELGSHPSVAIMPFDNLGDPERPLSTRSKQTSLRQLSSETPDIRKLSSP